MAVDPGPRRKHSRSLRNPVVRGESAADMSVAGESAADKALAGAVSGLDPDSAEGRIVASRERQQARDKMRPPTGRSGVLAGIEGTARIAAAIPSTLLTLNPDIVESARDTREFARSALDTIKDPGASKREKLEAALGTTVLAGGIGGGAGGGKVPKPKPGTFPVVPKALNAEGYDIEALRRIKDEGGDRAGTLGLAGSYAHGWDRPATGQMRAKAEQRWRWREEDRLRREAPKPTVLGDGSSTAPAVPKPAGAEKIVEALPEARRTRAQQEKGYSAEKAKRAAAYELEYERAGGGQAGHIAGKAALKGELPKLPFNRLMKEFGAADSELRAVFQPQVDEMHNFIRTHPSMEGRPFTVVSAREALDKALDGVTPQKSEIRLLEQVFGEEATQYFKWRAAREKAIKLANIPRSLQASYDLSANLRQLLVSGVRHPVLWQRVFRAQVRAARSQKAAEAMLDEIRARPRYDQMLDDGVKLTDIRARPGRLEEDFIGAEYAEKIPLVGHGVRWSTRAFTVGGAKMRADLYDLFMDQAEAAGKTLSKKERQSLASVINAGTGRGAMGLDVLEKAAPLGTVLLFSPRLIASRLAFFNPYWYATLSGPARKEAASSILSVVGLGSAVLWLAKRLGAEVEMDPRSADFGKIQVGDTRVDIWGGFQQYVVNGSRYAVAETKGPDGKVKKKTREEIAWNFASGKLAPIPGLGRDLQRGRTFDYQPVDTPLAGVPYGSAVGKLFVPLNVNNAWDAKEDPALAGLSLGLGGVGLGVQTYDTEEEDSAKSSKSLRSESKGRSKSLRQSGSKSKSLRRP